MARKPRDNKAAYARRKARAQARGYKSPYEEYKVRKALGMNSREFSRTTTPSKGFLPDWAIDVVSGSRMARLRREAKEWSDKHSHVKASKYYGTFSNKRVEEYHKAYVQRPDPKLSRRKRAIAKRVGIYEYLVANGFKVEGGPEDWKSDEIPA